MWNRRAAASFAPILLALTSLPSALAASDLELSAASGGWVDTGAANSLQEASGLFDLGEVDGAPALGTFSTLTNVHSHHRSADGWTYRTYRGQMRCEDGNGGVGVTFLSDYPRSDRYYRLRRYAGTDFHISPHGTSVEGVVTTGLRPVPSTWYAFAVEVTVDDRATRIRARVWDAATPEPDGWQIDCEDASASRRTHGTIGVWSMGPGAKWWRHLEVDLPGGDPGLEADADVATDPLPDESTPPATAIDAGSLDAGPLDGMPGPWIDTGSRNSLQAAPGLFATNEVAGELVRSTSSKATNIHSHIDALDLGGTIALEGRLRRDHSRGGIGVTFLSQYPEADRYYRLRQYRALPLHISPHGTRVVGVTHTDVVPEPGVWYRFRIETLVLEDRTEIRAKVWAQGDLEPPDWQIECADVSSSRLTGGTVGLWSMGRGTKEWAGISVETEPEEADVVLVDFESAVEGLDPLRFRRVVDPGQARSGEGSLLVDLSQATSLARIFPRPVAQAFLPYVILADRIEARFHLRVDQPLRIDLARLRPYLEESARRWPDRLTPAEWERLWLYVAALESTTSLAPTLDPDLWHALDVRFRLPDADGAGEDLEVWLDGQLVARLSGLSILNDGRVLAFLLAHATVGGALATDASRLWLDDIEISDGPILEP